MEREKTATSTKKQPLGSFLMILLAISLLGGTIFLATDYLVAAKQRSDLEKKRQALLAQIERLDQLYNNLQDEDYYILYIQEYYYQKDK